MTTRLNKSGRKASLFHEGDYLSSLGKNRDNLLVEHIGPKNIRCTFFEFKVRRPRYDASLVSGDLKAFEEGLEKKIGVAFKQEINLCRGLQDEIRVIPGLSVQDVTRWLFAVVVTDPFPSMRIMIDSIRARLAWLLRRPNVKYHGPFVFSLLEFEQLETLTPNRISNLLIDWESGPWRNLPFRSFYWSRTKGTSKENEYVSGLVKQHLIRLT
jgi:hypothetical protein